MTPNLSRRSMLVGTSTAIAGLLGVGSTVSADGHDIPVVIETVTPEQDLIVLRNEGDSEVDLSGYIIDWLYNNPDYDQSDSLPAGTHISAGGQLRITSGYYDTEADVEYDYGAGRINNDYTNVIALYTPSRNNAVSVFDTSTMEAEPGDPVDGGEPDEEPEAEGEDEPEEEEPEDDEPEDEDETEGDEPEEDEPEEEHESEEVEPEDEPEEDDEPVEATPTELSVSAPESISVSDSANFDVTVWNRGAESAEVTVTLEISNVSESATVEIAGKDCYASVHAVAGSDLCVGENEWTVTAGEASERGTLTVIDE